MPKKRWSEDDLDDTETYLSALGNKIDTPGDTLGATEWRRDLDSAPLARIADQAIRGEQPPTAGGTMSSVEENAAALVGLCDDFPYGPQQEVTNHFESLGARLTQILGQGHAANEQLQQGVNALMQASSGVYTMMEQFQQQIRDAADRLKSS